MTVFKGYMRIMKKNTPPRVMPRYRFMFASLYAVANAGRFGERLHRIQEVIEVPPDEKCASNDILFRYKTPVA